MLVWECRWIRDFRGVFFYSLFLFLSDSPFSLPGSREEERLYSTLLHCIVILGFSLSRYIGFIPSIPLRSQPLSPSPSLLSSLLVLLSFSPHSISLISLRPVPIRISTISFPSLTGARAPLTHLPNVLHPLVSFIKFVLRWLRQ